MRVEKYLSEQPPNIHNVNNVSELLPPPAEVVLALKRRLRDQNGSVTSVIWNFIIVHRLEGLATLLGDRGQPTEFSQDQGRGDRGRPNNSK